MFVDTHAHLNFKEFEKDYPAVIERAFKSGVKKIINVASNLENSYRAIKMARKFEKGVYATVGAHPIHIMGGHGLFTKDGMEPSLFMEDYEAKTKGKIYPLRLFKEAMNDPRVVAVGEIGLDYYHYPKKEERGQKTNKEIQKEGFRLFLQIAKSVKKPVITHSREAMKDFLDILLRHRMPGVVHCFQGSTSDVKKVLDAGFLVSFTGLITYSREWDEIVQYVPLNSMMIETDCPYMTPIPYRGQRNEPAYVTEVAKKIAELKNVSVDKVAKITTKNAKDLFKI